jgi:NADH-quinone oxidoreductase subunit I
MRATSPSGNAAFVGTVGWSGELGYGVRAPEAGQTDDDGHSDVAGSELDNRAVDGEGGAH